MSASEKDGGTGRRGRPLLVGARAVGIGVLSVVGAVMLYNTLVVFVDQALNGAFIG